MRARTRREILLLGILTAVLAGVLFMQFRGATDLSGPTPGFAAGGAPDAEQAEVLEPGLRLERLEGMASRLDEAEVRRNPFLFASEVTIPPGGVADTADLTPPEPEEPVLPQIPLRYIGRLVLPAAEGDQIVAVLSDQRGNVFHAQEGHVVEGRYRVLRVGVDSAEISYLDGRGRQTVMMSGQ